MSYLRNSNFPRYNELQRAIDNNYSLAAQYYSARELQFDKILKVQAQVSLESYITDINKKAKEFYSNIQKKASAIIQGTETMPDATDEEQAEYNAYIEDIIFAKNHSLIKMGSFAYRTGIPFEKWIANKSLSRGQINKIKKFKEETIPRIADSLILQQVGGISQKAAVIKKAGETRTDVAFKADGGKITKETQMELTTLINIEDISKQIKVNSTEAIMDYLLDVFKSSGNPDLSIFGFQLKAYSSLNDHRWMNSTVLQEAITNIYTDFAATTKSGKTWSSNYAVLYPAYFLSKYLINIYNPVNVGIITLDGFIRMTDIIDKYRLYMEVVYVGPDSPEESPSYRGGGIEIIPSIANNKVLFKEIAGKTLGVSKAHVSHDYAFKKTGIKVFSIEYK